MDLESAVSRVPSSDYLFVLIDANARTGVRMGEEDCKVIRAYGRDTRVSDSNGTSLLRFAGDPSSTRSSPSSKDARLVHSTVPGPWIGNVLTTSSRDNHTASLSEMSLFTCSRVRIPTTTSCAPESDSQADSLVIENSEPRQGARALTDEQSRLTPTDANGRFTCSQSAHVTELGGTVGEKAALFTDTFPRSAEEVMPGQIRQSRISGLLEDKAMNDKV